MLKFVSKEHQALEIDLVFDSSGFRPGGYSTKVGLWDDVIKLS